jgi:hypothetical protein
LALLVVAISFIAYVWYSWKSRKNALQKIADSSVINPGAAHSSERGNEETVRIAKGKAALSVTVTPEFRKSPDSKSTFWKTWIQRIEPRSGLNIFDEWKSKSMIWQPHYPSKKNEEITDPPGNISRLRESSTQTDPNQKFSSNDRFFSDRTVVSPKSRRASKPSDRTVVSPKSRGASKPSDGADVSPKSRRASKPSDGAGVSPQSRGESKSPNGAGMSPQSRGASKSSNGVEVSPQSRGESKSPNGAGVSPKSRGASKPSDGVEVSPQSRGESKSPNGAGVSPQSRGASKSSNGVEVSPQSRGESDPSRYSVYLVDLSPMSADNDRGIPTNTQPPNMLTGIPNSSINGSEKPVSFSSSVTGFTRGVSSSSNVSGSKKPVSSSSSVTGSGTSGAESTSSIAYCSLRDDPNYVMLEFNKNSGPLKAFLKSPSVSPGTYGLKTNDGKQMYVLASELARLEADYKKSRKIRNEHIRQRQNQFRGLS